MSLAALILSICAVIIGQLPFISFIATILAILALIFGIVSLASRSKKYNKSESITAIVFSGITLLIVVFKIILFILNGHIDLHFNKDNDYDYDKLKPRYDYEYHIDFDDGRILRSYKKMLNNEF